MSERKNDLFIYGMVSPDEYDWRAQFAACAKAVRRSGDVERVFDVGKVMGLADAYDSALNRITELEKERDAALAKCERYREALKKATEALKATGICVAAMLIIEEMQPGKFAPDNLEKFKAASDLALAALATLSVIEGK